jgi:hypothetical protein
VELKVSVGVCFVSEGHITHPQTVAVGQVMTERNAALLFNGELDNGHCDGLLPAEMTIY